LPNISHRPAPRARLPLIVLAAVAVLAAALVQTAAGAQRITRLPSLEAQVLTAINDVRRQHGLVPLRSTSALDSAAQSHSLSMAQNGYFAHSSLGGSSFRKRLKAAHHDASLGETMAWASPGLSARQALALWLHSPQHRRALLAPAWREIGLGAVHAPAAPGVFAGLAVTILTADFGGS
jgi:uncharacterized protein YkwD